MESSPQASLPVTQLRDRGRKDGTGTEETISYRPVKEGVGELMKLYKKAESAKQAYNDAVKSVAERGKCNSSVLKSLISSSAKGKFEDKLRLIEQQQAMFDTVGEVPGGRATEEK